MRLSFGRHVWDQQKGMDPGGLCHCFGDVSYDDDRCKILVDPNLMVNLLASKIFVRRTRDWMPMAILPTLINRFATCRLFFIKFRIDAFPFHQAIMRSFFD